MSKFAYIPIEHIARVVRISKPHKEMVILLVWLHMHNTHASVNVRSVSDLKRLLHIGHSKAKRLYSALPAFGRMFTYDGNILKGAQLKDRNVYKFTSQKTGKCIYARKRYRVSYPENPADLTYAFVERMVEAAIFEYMHDAFTHHKNSSFASGKSTENTVPTHCCVRDSIVESKIGRAIHKSQPSVSRMILRLESEGAVSVRRRRIEYKDVRHDQIITPIVIGSELPSNTYIHEGVMYMRLPNEYDFAECRMVFKTYRFYKNCGDARGVSPRLIACARSTNYNPNKTDTRW